MPRWLWDGNVPLHEWQYKGKFPPATSIDENNKLTEEAEPTDDIITWLFEENSFVPCAKLVGNERYSIISDYIGRPTHCYDEKGGLVWHTDYDIYGKLRNLQGEKGFIPFRQLGQYEDDGLGLYYNRFRYYDPESGVYLSQDQLGFAGGNPNFYAYVHDSNSWVDVFGLDIFNPIEWTAPNSGTGNTYKVHQQNIDWDMVDSRGRTNLQRASKGTAPLGNDGKSINLHHSKQNAQGPLFEVSDSMHKKYDRTNALHPYKVDGTGQHPHFPVDRHAFDTDRGAYWRDRANAENAKRKSRVKCK